jgi:small subunit ribosomal protein S9
MAEDDRNDELTPEEETGAEEPTAAEEETGPEEPTGAEEPQPLPEAEAPEETVVEPDAPEPAPAASGDTPPPGADEPLSEEAAEELEPTAVEVEAERREDEGAVLEEAAEEARRPRGKASERGERGVKEEKRDIIPGEHLEPILPVEQPVQPEGEFDYAASAYADEGDEEPEAEAPVAEEEAPAPAPLTPKELAADARYRATGKRKTSVARVILKPGSGTYVINGRTLEDFFPRATLQKAVRQPLQTAGYEESMDVVARIHGGGVSAQAGALRHGVARALVEADPNLRGELKRRGFLTRDARAKERKKAGLKKARKRPQFSKR